MFYNDNYLYALNPGFGFHIIDSATPEDPVVVARYETPGQASGLFVADNYAYIVDGDSGIQIADVSDPFYPEIVGQVGSGYTGGVVVSGDYAYLTDDDDRTLRVVDITDPTAPFNVSYLQAYGKVYYIDISGTTLFFPDQCPHSISVVHWKADQERLFPGPACVGGGAAKG